MLNNLNEIDRFDFNSVNLAPESPGVYAWYARFPAGYADYVRDMAADGTTDLGEQKLRQLLLLHSRKFEPEGYKIEATSTFETVWKGRLHPQTAERMDRVLSGVGIDESVWGSKEEAQNISAIQRPFRRQTTRHLLVELIKHAAPFLASPIYIGTTDNLRRRLGEHTSRILQLAEYMASQSERREQALQEIRAKGSTFAARVTALEMAPEHLEVYTLDVGKFSEEHKLNSNETADLAAALEWLLNRWHRPIAGRI
jgi:hypothetical protein